MLRNTLLLTVLFGIIALPAWADSPRQDFELYTLDDELYSLEETRNEESTEVVMVEFFSLACQPCIEALPDWKDFHEKHADSGAKVVFVALPARDDRDKSRAELEDFFAERDVSFPVVFDKYSRTGESYGVVEDGDANLPQAFAVAPSGEVLATGSKLDEIKPAILDRIE
jgi:thiol-disulfide isomerase/thioredoxin